MWDVSKGLGQPQSLQDEIYIQQKNASNIFDNKGIKVKEHKRPKQPHTALVITDAAPEEEPLRLKNNDLQNATNGHQAGYDGNQKRASTIKGQDVNHEQQAVITDNEPEEEDLRLKNNYLQNATNEHQAVYNEHQTIIDPIKGQSVNHEQQAVVTDSEPKEERNATNTGHYQAIYNGYQTATAPIRGQGMNYGKQAQQSRLSGSKDVWSEIGGGPSPNQGLGIWNWYRGRWRGRSRSRGRGRKVGGRWRWNNRKRKGGWNQGGGGGGGWNQGGGGGGGWNQGGGGWNQGGGGGEGGEGGGSPVGGEGGSPPTESNKQQSKCA